MYSKHFTVNNKLFLNSVQFLYKQFDSIYRITWHLTVTLPLLICTVYADSISGYIATSLVPGPDNLLPIDTSRLSIKLSPNGTYKQAKESVISSKKLIMGKFDDSAGSKDSLYKTAKVELEECIVNRLIPFWYGTLWDFEGYTHIPKKGFIACGYFVSTVLLHAGFSVNRYTLAQQAPYFEAISIQLSDSVQMYKNGFHDFSSDFKRKNSEGLYFAGLDCHVGFLLYRDGELLFIHSSYIDPLCVTIEIAEQSPAFTASQTYTIAEISTNKRLLDYWLNDKEIITRKE